MRVVPAGWNIGDPQQGPECIMKSQGQYCKDSKLVLGETHIVKTVGREEVFVESVNHANPS